MVNRVLEPGVCPVSVPCCCELLQAESIEGMVVLGQRFAIDYAGAWWANTGYQLSTDRRVMNKEADYAHAISDEICLLAAIAILSRRARKPFHLLPEPMSCATFSVRGS